MGPGTRHRKGAIHTVNSAIPYVPTDRHTSRATVVALAVVVGVVALSVRALNARHRGGYAEGYVDGATGRVAELSIPQFERSHLRLVK